VDKIQERIKPDVERLFDELGSPETFDYRTEIAEKIPFISITRMVGIPEKYWAEIHPVIMRFTETWNPTISDERREEARQLSNRAIDILQEVIAERRNSPEQDDFLSVLLQIEKENDKFEEWDIICLILALIGAGADTTLVGQQVKKGQMVLLMPHLRDYDTEYFEEPEKFDVTRNFEPDVVFGYGPRFCIGASLAKKQLQLTMEELFKRFPNARLLEEPERDPEDHNAIVFKNLIVKTNV
jgi:cytochrome P450